MGQVIDIQVEGIKKRVHRSEYTFAKWRQLKEFGYESLTLEEVERQLDAIYAKKKLTVIGMMMKDDVVFEN